jgi:hypothetical protein
MVTVRMMRPYVPVTLTRCVPWTKLNADKVRTDVPVLTMKSVLNVAFRPGGESSFRATAPKNPSSDVT